MFCSESRLLRIWTKLHHQSPLSRLSPSGSCRVRVGFVSGSCRVRVGSVSGSCRVRVGFVSGSCRVRVGSVSGSCRVRVLPRNAHLVGQVHHDKAERVDEAQLVLHHPVQRHLADQEPDRRAAEKQVTPSHTNTTTHQHQHKPRTTNNTATHHTTNYNTTTLSRTTTHNYQQQQGKNGKVRISELSPELKFSSHHR